VARPGGGGRRLARERALSILYEAESRGVTVETVVGEQPVAPDPFAVELVVGVAAAVGTIDEVLDRFATGWRVERMAAIDRAVLRIGVFELGHRPDTPTGVVLAEAVALATKFSTAESGRFVNGVLARVAEDLRPAATVPD
jgi:N utilization substance protein B